MLRVTVTRSINVIFALLTCQLFLGLVRSLEIKIPNQNDLVKGNEYIL